MADRHQLKIADRNGIAEDDPFAELTRIMGFDPREPVRAQAVSARPPEQADAPGDFDIDLEKELLGEFATYDELAQAAPAQAQPDAPVEEDEAQPVEMSQPVPEPQDHAVAGVEMDDAVAASLEHDFVAAGEAEPDAVAVEPAAFATAHEIHADWRHVAVEPYAAPEALEAADADEVAAALHGTWFGPAQDEAAEDGDGAAEQDETVAAQAFDGNDFDAAVSADLGDETSPGDDLGADGPVNAIGDETAPAYEAPAYEAPAYEAPAYENFASGDEDAPFEDGAPEEQPAEAAMASYEQEDAAPYQDPLDDRPEALNAYRQPAQAAAVLDDIDAHFDSAMADVDMDFAARPQAVAAVTYNLPEDQGPAHQQVQAQAPAVEDVEDDSDAGVDAAFDDAFAHEPVTQHLDVQAQPEAVRSESNTLEDELNALLAKMTTRPAVSTASAWPLATPVARKESAPAMPVPQPAAPAAEDEIHAALMADLHAMDLGDASPHHEETDFDADAFHAALAEAGDDRHSQPAAVAAPSSDWSAPELPTAQPATTRAAPRYEEAPELETVDVPERVVALADDLDIPDVPFEEAGAGNKFYDDLDSEFADLLGKIDAAPEATHAAYDDDAYGADFHRGHMQPPAAPAAGAAAQAASSLPASAYAAAAGRDAGDLPASRAAMQGNPFTVDELAYDPEDALALAGPAQPEAAPRRPQRRGLLVAGIICAVAVAGGLGALALSFGGNGGADAPALVKADNSPIKVKPENPGGTVIPNQDNKVYEAVAKGLKPADPAQPKLVTANEEPIDVNAAPPQSRVVDLPAQADAAAPVAAATPAATPVAKSEERVEQTAQADAAAPDVPVVAPRKVRTMVVKPDGSLVPREDPAPAVAASEPADPAPQHVVAVGEQTGAVPPASANEPALKPAKAAGVAPVTPKTAPIAPQRPSDQPLDVVGEVKPDQVAALDTAAPAPGSWSMQIASQPTADSAQSTYQDLARRYGGVLEGHGVNIVKADIAGKGTFYRVRVPAQSRNDAIKLCESYKAAGGNCFVSK